jgi:hypothetical protein
MAQIKSLTAIRDKWTQVTPSRAPQYQAGVQSPMADWATNAKAAAAAFEQGITQAVANHSFEKGVSAAGTAEWQEGALQKGVTRYGPGVAQAGPKYEEGFAPYHEVIARLTLPARGMRGDPRNYQRVQVVGDALHAKKVSG